MPCRLRTRNSYSIQKRNESCFRPCTPGRRLCHQEKGLAPSDPMARKFEEWPFVPIEVIKGPAIRGQVWSCPRILKAMGNGEAVVILWPA